MTKLTFVLSDETAGLAVERLRALLEAKPGAARMLCYRLEELLHDAGHAFGNGGLPLRVDAVTVAPVDD